MKPDLLPDDLKYWWADDEEGPYQGPFDSREQAFDDAYCYRAGCFDDPGTKDGVYILYGQRYKNPDHDPDYPEGEIAEHHISGKPEYVTALDITDFFHRCYVSLKSRTPNKSAEVDPNNSRPLSEIMADLGTLSKLRTKSHIDTEALKHGPVNISDNKHVAGCEHDRGWNDCIDYLVEQAIVKTPNKPAEVDLDVLKRECEECAKMDRVKKPPALGYNEGKAVVTVINYPSSNGHLATGKGWQPIETAPFREYVILNISPLNYPVIAARDEEGWMTRTGAFYGVDTADYWMPLPQKPEKAT